MDTIEYRSVDKSDWLAGPWQGEPDKRQWRDPETGLPCLIVRSGASGALCGYVGVALGHPLHGIGYSEPAQLPSETAMRLLEGRGYSDLYADDAATGEACPEALFDVHGGLTFSRGCGHNDNPAEGICHVPGPGEPDDVWWFGFDCSHAGDLAPSYGRRLMFAGDTYRDLAYVEGWVQSLARQLASVA